MLDGLKPYPEYVAANIPGVNAVPAHWRAARIKTALRELDHRSRDGSGTLLSLTRVRGLIRQSEMTSKATTAATLEGYKLYHPGEIVMNRMQAWSGMFGTGPEAGLVSPDYAVFSVLDSNDPAFLVHLLRSPAMVAQFAVESKGIGSGFNRLYTDKFGAISMPLPPPAEQAVIVRFLGAVDRKVNRFIRAKRRLIEVLTEQKQAIITHAVTRGLNSDSRLKPSGKAWLPEVPAGWSVVTLRRVITRAVDGPHHSPAYVDQGVMFISARNVKVDEWSLADAKYISQGDYEEFSRRITPEVGDVLYTKGGTTGVARAVDLDFPFQVWVHIAVLKLRRKVITPAFLALALNSTPCYRQAQLYTRGATNQDLGLGRMKDIELPLPPTIAEQDSIVEYVNNATGAIRRAVADCRREIDLIREYRTRLVADVVTGKLDVRGLALPTAEAQDEEDANGEVELDDPATDAVEESAEKVEDASC